ncbi:hypothetical protein CTI12_AA077570 [Artemisia annua]|uniref:Uncharacterized protein n=1 Tax=Artemisia annua TaxID=35608 RepID=A0A2U1Q4B8_ARTAN|nr:hypothetical protein CTI12_AA077570 [Artemisia annua]
MSATGLEHFVYDNLEVFSSKMLPQCKQTELKYHTTKAESSSPEKLQSSNQARDANDAPKYGN